MLHLCLLFLGLNPGKHTVKDKMRCWFSSPQYRSRIQSALVSAALGLGLSLNFLLSLSSTASANDHVFEIHAIAPLFKKGLTGSGQVIGVLDVGGTQDTQAPLPASLQGHFVEGSWLPVDGATDHGACVSGLISSQQENGAKQTSIAPGARVDYAFSDEIFANPIKTAQGLRFKWEKVLGAPSTLEALEKLTEGKAFAINVSRTIPLRHSKRLKSSFEGYAKKGGVFITPLGNLSLSWQRNILAGLPNEISEKIEANTISNQPQEWDLGLRAYIGDSLFFNWIAENPALFEATLFVAGLDKTGRSRLPMSNVPGDFAPQRTLMVVGEEIQTQNKEKVDGTSYASAVTAGVLALLQESFPACSATRLAQALLDSATYEGLGVYHQERWIEASRFDLATRLKFFGRGKLDAHAALLLAEQLDYCGTR